MSAAQHLRFLAAFLRRPTRIGAIAPSAPALARGMLAGIRLDPGQCIIEFGPGTGSFTNEIRKVLPDPSAYLGIDLEPSFIDPLRRRFSGLRFVQGSAADAVALHKQAGLGRVRAIISGLPFASWPETVQEPILAAMDELMGPGSEFRTFHYAIAYYLPAAVRFRRLMQRRFGPHRRGGLIMLNLPPAFVMTWKRGAE